MKTLECYNKPCNNTLKKGVFNGDVEWALMSADNCNNNILNLSSVPTVL